MQGRTSEGLTSTTERTTVAVNCFSLCPYTRDLNNNSLSGVIPINLSSAKSLRVLYVQQTHAAIILLHYTVTTTCCSPCYHGRELNSNRLNGTIPNSLGSAKSLTTLYVRWSPQVKANHSLVAVMLL